MDVLKIFKFINWRVKSSTFTKTAIKQSNCSANLSEMLLPWLVLLQAFHRSAIWQAKWGSCFSIQNTVEYIIFCFLAVYLGLSSEAQSRLARMKYASFASQKNCWNFFRVVNARSYDPLITMCCFIQLTFVAWLATMRTPCWLCEVFVTYAGICDLLYTVTGM